MGDLSKICLVIPTIRDIDWTRLKHVPEEVNIKVMWDKEKAPKINTERKNVEFYSHSDVPQSLVNIVSKGSAACVNYVSLQAYKEGFDKILFTHDDCVVPEDWVSEYDRILGSEQKVEHVTSDNGWYNTFESLNVNGFQRGYPHLLRDGLEHTTKEMKDSKKIMAHMGFWSNHLDLDGIDKYNGKMQQIQPKSRMFPFHQVVECHFPFSNMNFGIKAEVLPFFAQIPMPLKVNSQFDLWRYDDVWCGYLTQSLLKEAGYAFSIGSPYIHHLKEGNLKKEILGEFFGQLLSPNFYKEVNFSMLCGHYNNPVSTFNSFLSRFSSLDWNYDCVIDKQVIKKIREGLLEWVDCFENTDKVNNNLLEWVDYSED